MSVESERSIGERAVAKGWLLPADLHRALLIRRNARNATLDEILVDHGILSEAQVRELVDEIFPARLHCTKCGKSWRVTAAVASETRDCKACGAPFGASEPPPARRRFGIVVGIGAGALVATAAALAILLAREDPPPPTPPPARALPKAAEKPRPPEPVPLAERIAALTRREEDLPGSYRSLCRLWAELLAEAAGTAQENDLRAHLDALRTRAKKEFDEAYRSVREDVNSLIGRHLPTEAKARLQEWKFPEELDVDGSGAEEVRKQKEFVEVLVTIQELARTAPKDASALLAPFLSSDREEIRAEAERARLQLRFATALRERRVRIEEGRGAAAARIEKARREKDLEEKADRDRTLAWEKRMRELSAKKPWPARTFGLNQEAQLRVTSFDGRRIVFGDGRAEVGFEIHEVPEDVLRAVLTMAADPSNAEDLLRAGRIASRRQAWTAATGFFREAKKLDPSIEPRLPDVERMSRGISSLHGAASIRGRNLRLRYRFDDADEGKDFQPMDEASLRVAGGSMTVSGRGLFTVSPGELKYWERAQLDCTVDLARDFFVVGAAFEYAPGKNEFVLTYFHDDGTYRVCRLHADGSSTLHTTGSAPRGRTFRMKFDGRDVSVFFGEKELWSGTLEPFASLTPIFGGACAEGESGYARFAEIVIDGEAAGSWIQRLQAERAATIEAELAKDLRTTASERAASSSGGDRRFGEDLLAPLPFEKELETALPPDMLKLWTEARSLLRRVKRSRTFEDYEAWSLEIDDVLARAVREAPWIPLGHYYQAEWKALRGDLRGALAGLDEAVRTEESFLEARVSRAELRLQLGRPTEAKEDIVFALLMRPDCARARLVSAQLLHLADRAAEAAAETDLAMRLDPQNPALRRAAKRLRNIIAGPLWTEPVTVETPNYLLRAEVPQRNRDYAKTVGERLRKYGDYLELLRDSFASLVQGTPLRARKPVVFLFQTEESYALYGDFTLEDRLEHTSGCFLPEYQQLLFYDEASLDTLATMAHEAFHEYMNAIVPGVPTWLSEGMAEYAAGVRLTRENRVVPGQMHTRRLLAIQGSLRSGWKGVPLRLFLLETQGQFYSLAPGLQYAQAWSFVHFLIHGHGGRFRPLLDRYVELLVGGASASTAFAETFAKEDLALMQEQWYYYVLGLQ